MQQVEDKIARLIDWLEPEAYISPNVKILELPSKGRSVVANGQVMKGSLLIRVRRSHLLNIMTVPNRNTRLSSHQQIAWFIYTCLDDELCAAENENWKPFIDLMPTREEFAGIPLTWSEEKLKSLPKSTRAHVQKQKTNFENDFNHVIQCNKDSAPVIDRDLFLYCWLCVNTRCLFMAHPGADHKDNFTMAPFVDFMNHLDDNSQTVKVRMSALGMEVYSTKSYQDGEEIYLNYGPHDNSFLLCEYGFVADQNKWDTIDISDSVEALFSDKVREELKETGYLGEYTVNNSGPSFRTEVALACWQQGGLTNKVRQMMEGIDEGDRFERITRKIVLEILEDLKQEWSGSLEEGHKAIMEDLRLSIEQRDDS